ncbi:MAG TPA: hypothetical protein VM686_04945 [Polyangiaceae bacterium]|nr:hypothetical protein [Polyangiaceae bacterium]
MMRNLAAVLLLACAVTTACGGDDDDDDDNCANTAGSWAINGCFSLNCTVAQSECSITVSCNSLAGPVTFTGSVDGNELSFVNDMGGSCEGTISGDQMIGTCTSDTGTCEWDADRN